MTKQYIKDIALTEDVLIYFYSDRCASCKITDPMVYTIANKLKIRLIRFNEHKSLEKEYQIYHRPHLIWFQKNVEKMYPGVSMIKNLYNKL